MTKPYLLPALSLALLAAAAAVTPGLAAPSLDPFVPLIEKPAPPPPPPPPPDPIVIPPGPPPPAPLRVEVLAWMGGEVGDMALIEYQGEEYLVASGWDGVDQRAFDGRFQVVEVTGDSLVVFDRKVGQRRTFRDSPPGSSDLSISGE